MGGRVVAILVAVALALAATVALVAYAGSADRRAMRAQQPVLVYVARARIAAGTSGEDAQNRGLIERVALPRRAVAAGAVSSLEQLGGRVAAVDILTGEHLLAARWAGRGRPQAAGCSPSPTGTRRSRSPWTRPGRSPGSSPPATASACWSRSASRGATGRSGPPASCSRTSRCWPSAPPPRPTPPPRAAAASARARPRAAARPPSTVTLAVAPREVERVVFAAENGSLYLSLLPPGQRPVPSRARTIDNEF